MGAQRAWIGFPVRVGLPDRKARLLYAPRPGSTGLLARLRPDIPWLGTRIGRAAAAPLRRLLSGAERAPYEPSLVRGLPGGVQTWHAAAWRLRDWPGALGGATGGGTEYSRDYAVPARPQPTHTMMRVLSSELRV